MLTPLYWLKLNHITSLSGFPSKTSRHRCAIRSSSDVQVKFCPSLCPVHHAWLHFYCIPSTEAVWHITFDCVMLRRDAAAGMSLQRLSGAFGILQLILYHLADCAFLHVHACGKHGTLDLYGFVLSSQQLSHCLFGGESRREISATHICRETAYTNRTSH